MLENTLNARIERNKGYIQCINALALLCSINTGMRIAELSGLKWEHISEKTIHICAQIVRDGKTYKYINTTKDEKYREDENGGRYIPLTNKLKAIFKIAREKQEQYGIETDFVFGRNETFSNPNQIESALYHTAQELGLNCTNNHAIRIYFNSYVLAKNGVRVSERAKFLGHSAKINEEVYTLPLNDDEFLVEMESILEKENKKENVTQKSYHFKTKRKPSIACKSRVFKQITKVPAVGLEPTRSCPRKILSLVRLPIPPHRLVDFISHQRILVYINIIKMSILFSPFSDFLYKSFDDIKAVKCREVILRRFRTTNHLIRTIFFQKYLS